MSEFAGNERMTEIVARRFRALGEPYRLRLLQVLETGEKTVGELVAALGGNQPNTSKHLQILYSAGVLSRRREGTSIRYAISDPVVLKLCELVCKGAASRSRAEFEELNAKAVVSKPKRQRVSKSA